MYRVSVTALVCAVVLSAAGLASAFDGAWGGGWTSTSPVQGVAMVGYRNFGNMGGYGCCAPELDGPIYGGYACPACANAWAGYVQQPYAGHWHHHGGCGRRHGWHGGWNGGYGCETCNSSAVPGYGETIVPAAESEVSPQPAVAEPPAPGRTDDAARLRRSRSAVVRPVSYGK